MAARDVLHFGCGTTQRRQAFGGASSYKHFYCFPKQFLKRQSPRIRGLCRYSLAFQLFNFSTQL
jgi:hypothetical protein